MRSIKLPSWISRALGAGARSTPPHAFAISDGVLSYAHFASGADREALGFEEVRRWEIPNELLGKGPMGGPVRDQAGLDAFVASCVAEIDGSLNQASLVVPDEWSRVVFLESEDLPRGERARDETLRWKLKQQIPFRVEDLRVRGAVVPALEDQEEPRRLLVGFGSEQLLGGLESAFLNAGVRLGHLGNRSMAFAEGVSEAGRGEAFLWGGSNGYSLVVLDRGEPVLFRSKSLEASLSDEVVGGMVEREIRLTLGFLAKKAPGVKLRRVVVAGSDARSVWIDAVTRGVGASGEGALGAGTAAAPALSIEPAERAVEGQFDLSSARNFASMAEWLPLFGAVQRAVG